MASSVSVDEVLSRAKFQLFTMNLTSEELKQISLCRRGILGASSLGAIFGVFGGKVALSSSPSSLLLKSIVMGGKFGTKEPWINHNM